MPLSKPIEQMIPFVAPTERQYWERVSINPRYKYFESIFLAYVAYLKDPVITEPLSFDRYILDYFNPQTPDEIQKTIEISAVCLAKSSPAIRAEYLEDNKTTSWKIASVFMAEWSFDNNLTQYIDWIRAQTPSQQANISDCLQIIEPTLSHFIKPQVAQESTASLPEDVISRTLPPARESNATLLSEDNMPCNAEMSFWDALFNYDAETFFSLELDNRNEYIETFLNIDVTPPPRYDQLSALGALIHWVGFEDYQEVIERYCYQAIYQYIQTLSWEEILNEALHEFSIGPYQNLALIDKNTLDQDINNKINEMIQNENFEYQACDFYHSYKNKLKWLCSITKTESEWNIPIYAFYNKLIQRHMPLNKTDKLALQQRFANALEISLDDFIRQCAPYAREQTLPTSVETHNAPPQTPYLPIMTAVLNARHQPSFWERVLPVFLLKWLGIRWEDSDKYQQLQHLKTIYTEKPSEETAHTFYSTTTIHRYLSIFPKTMRFKTNAQTCFEEMAKARSLPLFNSIPHQAPESTERYLPGGVL